MTPSHIPPALLVTLLSAATFLARTAALMLGPLLVALASAGGVLWVTITSTLSRTNSAVIRLAYAARRTTSRERTRAGLETARRSL